MPAAAEAVGAAVDRTERSAPFEKGLAGATGKVKVAGNGTGNGNGNENGYENGLGTEMSRGLTPTDASGRQKRSEADAIEREGAGLKMKRRADSEEDGPREPGEGVECPVKCQKRFEAGAKEKDSGGSESEGWQSVTAEFEENDEMPKVVTDAKPKGFEAASCDEPATTGAGRPTGSAGERPTEAPTGAVNLRQPRKEIESLERETEGGLARLQEPPLDRTSDEKAILAREAAENGGPKFGIDVTRTEGVILEKPLVEMLAGFGARPPAASPVRGDATGENTETAQPVSENRIACVPLAEPSATGAAPEERKRSAEPEERKSSAKAGSAAEVSERKRSTGEESAAAAKRTVDVEEPPRLSQNPAHIAGNEGVTGGYDFYAKLTPAVVTGGLSQGLSGASRPPSRQSFSAYPSPPPAKSETDDWVDGPSFEETRWMLLGGGAAITGPGKRAGNMFGAQHGGNAGRENGQPTLGIGSPGRNTPVKMVPPDYVGGGLQPVAGPADGE